MGRELRRVPLDFDWPLNKPWAGFLNPHCQERRKCPACEGDSYSPAGRLLNDLWYLRLYGERVPATIVAALAGKTRIPLPLLRFAARIVHGRVPWRNALEQCDVDALIAAERLWDFTRVPRTEEQREVVRQRQAGGHNSWLPTSNGYRPTAAEVNEWSQCGFGHDSTNAWICQKARAKTYGVATYCRACRGSGNVPDASLSRKIRAWKETPVPTGEGYQLWETVSEGSPITPVFATPEGLALHMSAPTFKWGSQGPSQYETALMWIRGPGVSMSAASVGGRMVDPMALAVGQAVGVSDA